MTDRIFVDLTPLRTSSGFRRLWFGYMARLIGAQITITTVLYQVYAISHSNLMVGLISAAQLVPGVITPIIGGAIVDAIDRRRLLGVNAVLFAVVTAGLAINCIGQHPQMWVLFLCSALTWGLNGLDNPTRNAMLATYLDAETFAAGSVLRQWVTQLSQVAGPSLAGVLIAIFSHGLEWVYWIDVATTVAALVTAFALPAQSRADTSTTSGRKAIAEGFRFLRQQRLIQASFAIDINATLLGSPTALLPYMALVHLHGGARSYGLLAASPGIGAIVGGVVSGWTARVKHQGRAVMVAVVVWGIANATLGISPWLWLGVVALAISGWANAVSAAMRNTILLLITPGRLRGRLTSIASISFQLGRLGNLESGAVAAISTAPISIISGGLGCILGVLLVARLYPEYRRATVTMGDQLVTEPPSDDSGELQAAPG